MRNVYMIKAVLIDDEKPALRELEYLLSEYKDINILGTFTNPLSALSEIAKHKPHIVFLDINMPQLKGIDLASEIISFSPDTDIVFISGYNYYATEAFEVYALDYLLKPLEKKRLDKTMRRVLEKYKNIYDKKDKKLIIKCFGEFQIGWNGEDFIKWRTQKTKELFAFLLHNYGKNVSKYKIIDAVWPDIEPEKADHHLYNGIYYIRKELKEFNIMEENVSIGDKYCLKLWNVDFDLEKLNKYLPSDISALSADELQEIEEICSKEYFENCDWPWVEYDRNNYSRQYYRISCRLSKLYFENNDFEKTEKTLSKIIKSNPYEEEPIFILMKTYLSMNDKFRAMELYNSYKKLLDNDLGIFPSSKLTNYYILLSV